MVFCPHRHSNNLLHVVVVVACPAPFRLNPDPPERFLAVAGVIVVALTRWWVLLGDAPVSWFTGKR